MVGGHQPQHRSGKQGQQTCETTQVWGVPVEVSPGVGLDPQADAGDEQHHHQRKRIDPHVQAQVKPSDPRDRLGHRRPVENAAGGHKRPHQRHRRRNRRHGKQPTVTGASNAEQGHAKAQVQEEQNGQRGPPCIDTHREPGGQPAKSLGMTPSRLGSLAGPDDAANSHRRTHEPFHVK